MRSSRETHSTAVSTKKYKAVVRNEKENVRSSRAKISTRIVERTTMGSASAVNQLVVLVLKVII
ncbi:MAG: hypothetical protein HDR10_05925 [Lachnospiraceae bacterium]|nr:hypothetical protein [Lachnospiraceae bacterium]